MNPVEISPAEFRRVAERLIRLAEDYLERLDERSISPHTSGEETERILCGAVPESGLGEPALRELEQVIRLSRAQNGRFFGYVLGSGEPVAAATDLLASVLNQNVTAWRSSPAAAVLEQTVMSWLAEAIGCAGFHGYLTGGGSSANLMGLAMAREARLAANETGIVSGARGVVYASDEVHMSIPKSIALLGIGRQNLRLIPTDDSFRMIPGELAEAMRRGAAEGKVPIAVVASAGTVNTGAIDDLRAVAEIARGHGAWFHVDGAYGALAALAEREKFAGLELADSISLDPHKWLYQPLDVGCLLYRSRSVAQQTFAHSGDYARTLQTDPVESFAFFEESLELSRRFRALKLWLSLRYHGLAAFRESIKLNLRHARRLAEAIGQEPALELMAPVELSAVCFRYVGRAREHQGYVPEEDRNKVNQQILQRTVERGRVYLSNASLRGKFCLRACIVNHRTRDSDVDAVVPEVMAAAQQIQI